MHGLDVIIERNVKATVRELAHAYSDARERVLDNSQSLDALRAVDAAWGAACAARPGTEHGPAVYGTRLIPIADAEWRRVRREEK